MTNRRDRERERQLEEQARRDREARDAAITRAAAPTPLETLEQQEQLDWRNTVSGANGPFDVTNLRQMKPYLDLYNRASQRQQGERMGTGAIQLGAQGQNPMLGQLLREQSQNERQQSAAGGLENAFRFTDASMRGNAFPLMSLQQNRTMGLAGMTSGNSANATGQWANFRPAPSFWSNLLMAGVQGAAGYFAGGSGRRP